MVGNTDFVPRPSGSNAASPAASQEAGKRRATTLALAAIGWILQDDDRAQRYLALTGLDPDTLRGGLGNPHVLASALEFLANHEPDLMAAAQALAVEPQDLVSARRELAK